MIANTLGKESKKLYWHGLLTEAENFSDRRLLKGFLTEMNGFELY